MSNGGAAAGEQSERSQDMIDSNSLNGVSPNVVNFMSAAASSQRVVK